MIRRFRDDPAAHVILMSYGAGAVGLNLQFAGYVFLFDRWWNPAVEDQAINRAHRIGAAGPITVTRFPGARHDRGADRPRAAGEAGAVRDDLRQCKLLQRRRARQAGPDALRAPSASSVRPAAALGSVPHRVRGTGHGHWWCIAWSIFFAASFIARITFCCGCFCLFLLVSKG